MWPWEHLALGYLAVSIAWRIDGRPVDGWVAASVAFGTQLPDIVDKFLAWYLAVLPSARSLMHSVLVAVPVSVFVLALAVHRDRSAAGLAFVVGYTSHLFGDALPKILNGHYQDIHFLLWPAIPNTLNDDPASVLNSFREILSDPMTYATSGSYRTAILVSVVLLWASDGFPGAVGVGQYLRNTAREHVME